MICHSPTAGSPTREGEGSRFLVHEVDAEVPLPGELRVGEQRLLRQDELEALAAPVARDPRRHVSQLLPVPEHVAEAPPGVLAEADAAEREHDSRIAYFPLARLEQIRIGGERVAGVPEDGLVSIVPDDRRSGMVGVVLVHDQVYHRFPKGVVVGRRGRPAASWRGRAGRDAPRTSGTSPR